MNRAPTIHTLLALACGAGLACSTPPATGDSGDSSGSDSEDSSDSGDSGDSGSSADSGPDTGDSGTDTGPAPDMGTIPDPNRDIPPLDEEGCPGLYAQDLLPTFALTLAPEVWAMLVEEWHDGAENEQLGINPNPYHSLAEFRYGDIVITDAEIRLRGNPDSWSVDDKLQFQIGFNQIDENGRFLGLRRMAFDAATFNRHMLRDRLALSIMRDMGIAAPCANSARLNINGEYYGLFTNLEKLDESFLERVFDDPTGDLWKRANWEITTNEDTATTTRLDALEDAASPEQLAASLDLEQALAVFAAEAIIPDSDGMWAGGLNFYIYDDPIRGKFVLLPWDLDNTFERFNDLPEGEYPANPDPVVWEKPTTHGRPWYDLALQDPQWFAYYIATLEQQVAVGYVPASLHERIDTWSAQIHDAVFEDLNKPYTNAIYLAKVQELHAYVQARSEFLTGWLVCWQNGGVADAEGYCVP